MVIRLPTTAFQDKRVGLRIVRLVVVLQIDRTPVRVCERIEGLAVIAKMAIAIKSIGIPQCLTEYLVGHLSRQPWARIHSNLR